MSVGSVIGKIIHGIGRVFSSKTLTAVEAWAAQVAPEFTTDLLAISAKLPNEFESLKELAMEAQRLYQAAKGTKISLSLAIQLAQVVFTANRADLEAEAAAELKKLEG